VHTASGTVNAIGTGVFGTVTGLGKRLGHAVICGGSAIGETFGLEDQRRGNNKEFERLSRDEIRKTTHTAKRKKAK
jgi:hypothetical protein